MRLRDAYELRGFAHIGKAAGACKRRRSLPVTFEVTEQVEGRRDPFCGDFTFCDGLSLIE